MKKYIGDVKLYKAFQSLPEDLKSDFIYTGSSSWTMPKNDDLFEGPRKIERARLCLSILYFSFEVGLSNKQIASILGYIGSSSVNRLWHLGMEGLRDFKVNGVLLYKKCKAYE